MKQSNEYEDNRRLRTGDRVEFGRYPQSCGTPEPIIWRILDITDGRALLITEELLDCVRFNEKPEEAAWGSCTLRKWLNGEFYDAAFDPGEQSVIAAVTNDDAEGAPARDRVFCLSADETVRYFSGRTEKRRGYDTYPDRMAMPTMYARKSRSVVFPDLGTGWWWLRSPGKDGGDAACVDIRGDLRLDGIYVDDDSCCVRPVILVSL